MSRVSGSESSHSDRAAIRRFRMSRESGSESIIEDVLSWWGDRMSRASGSESDGGLFITGHRHGMSRFAGVNPPSVSRLSLSMRVYPALRE